MRNKKSQFQYVPSSGALPGKDFEEQTEVAINEVSDVALEAGDKADDALETANEAIKIAHDALDTANTAQSTANTALATAVNAKNTADQALVNSEKAIDRADDAFDKASNAESIAAQGNAAAGQALSKANQALATATQADQKADKAQTIAIGTSEALEKSLYYQHPITTYEPFVLNDEYNSAKYFIINTSLPNLPGTTKEQGFLTIRSEKKEGGAISYRVYQNYHTLTEKEYCRTGNIVIAADGTEGVTWGKWIKSIAENDKVIININNMLDEDGKIKDGYISNSALTTINNYVSQNIIDASGEKPGALQSYVDSGDFLNFPPKIGFFDETTVPIFSAFNMNYMGRTIRGFWCVSDSLGREVMYFYANNGKDSPTKLFRATRLNDGDKFAYENNPIHPAYMGDNDYPISCFGLGTDYIFYNCMFGGANKRHLVITNGSSVYTNWDKYIDVTSITTGSEMGIFYFSEFKTIALVTYEIQSKLKLYKASDLTLIREVSLMDIQTALTIDDPTKVEVTSGPGVHFHGGATYIKNRELLVTYYDISYWFKNLETNNSYHHYPATTQIYQIPITWFQGGTGAITEKIPHDQYRLNQSGFYGDGHGGRGCVTICGVYDEYEETLRTQTGGWDDINTYLRRVDVNNQPLTSGFGFTNIENQINVITPDGSPWAKWMYNPILYGNQMFLHCRSYKYGDQFVKIKYRKDANNANYIEVIPGKWELTAGIDWHQTMCQRVNASTTKWHVARHNSNIQEVVFDADGNRSYIDTAFTTPLFPADKECISTFGYNLNTNVIYYIARDKTPTDPEYKNYPYLLTYTKSTGVWKSYNDPTFYPDSWNDRFRETFTFNKTYGFGATYSNIFIDLDGAVYATVYFSRTDWAVSGLYKFVINGGTLTCTYVRNLGWGWGDQMISYDKTFGYVLNLRYYDQSRGRIDSSKDYYGAGTEKTAAEFWSGQFYTSFIGLSSASGLVAYSQETPIFLGGYYSVIPAQEIVLEAESDNYVYLVRDRANRHNINVLIRKKMFGVKGETAFNRILATRIKTNAAESIEQEYYPLDPWK